MGWDGMGWDGMGVGNLGPIIDSQKESRTAISIKIINDHTWFMGLIGDPHTIM